MASPLIIRKGEGKKTIMIGPDAWSFRITGADVKAALTSWRQLSLTCKAPLAPSL